MTVEIMTIKSFIKKWQPILTAWENSSVEDPQLAEDCWAVGFDMDGGRSIVALSPEKDWLKADVLKKNLHLITDVNVMGSAIFSHWRYYTHGYGPLADDAIEWFTIAFDHLRALNTAKKENGFQK